MKDIKADNKKFRLCFRYKTSLHNIQDSPWCSSKEQCFQWMKDLMMKSSCIEELLFDMWVIEGYPIA